MFLGFDLGTTNVKAQVVDAAGRIVGAGAAPVERWVTPDGGVEQDIEQIWAATRSAIGQAAAGCGAQIQAIGVSSQGGAVQILDDHDRPLHRVISWLDRRGAPFDRELIQSVGADWLAAHVGHGGSSMTLGQVLRLNSQSPSLLRPPHRLGFVGDVIVGRLCGRRAHDPTSLAIALLYNPWIRRADPELLARLSLDEGQLPDLVPLDQPAGGLSTQAAAELSLTAGIPVAPAVHDQYAAALGAGALAPGEINFGAGTAWVLLANTARLAQPIVASAFVAPHPVPGVWGQMLSLVNGGSAIEWALRLVGQTRASLEDIDRYAEQSPPGSAGLRCWPLLLPGAEPHARSQCGGSLERITLAHGPPHLVRAVLEGLACELARHLRVLTQAGFPAQKILMSGSAAASRTTPQLLADVLDLPVTCVNTSDVSALGAAMIARSLWASGDLVDVARSWLPPGRTIDPGPQHAIYAPLLAEYLESFQEPICAEHAHRVSAKPCREPDHWEAGFPG